MAASHALFKPQALKQLAQIVKTDARVGRSAEKASERFLSAHNDILHGSNHAARPTHILPSSRS